MIGRFINLEFLWPAFDYVRSLTLRDAVLDIGVPIAVCTATQCFVGAGGDWADFYGTAVNFLAILIGFTTAALAVAYSFTGDASGRISKAECEVVLDGKPITLARLLHIHFSYTLTVEIVALGFSLGAMIFAPKLNGVWVQSGLRLVALFLIAHVLLVTLRNSATLYHVFWRMTGNEDTE